MSTPHTSIFSLDRNNTVVLFGTVEFGEIITTNSSQQFNPIDGNQKDAYF